MSRFLNMHRHGFLRVAVATPRVAAGDPAVNLARTLDLARAVATEEASLVLFPELGLSGYAIDDLLQQDALLASVEGAVARLLEASRGLAPVIVVGAPVRLQSHLYNAALIIHRGVLLGVVPKTYLPNYREFYERRHFVSGIYAAADEIALGGQRAPFGTDLLFAALDLPDFVLHAEICEDVWVPIPPSSYAALAGASVIVNLSASNAIIGKSDYRHALCRAHSGRLLAAYLYSAAGSGESTTDLAWDGHAMIYENGVLMAEASRFATGQQVVFADLDLELLRSERTRQGSFADCAGASLAGRPFRRIGFTLAPALDRPVALRRPVQRFPYVPSDEARLAELCYEAYNIQVAGLRQRLEATGIKRLVIGVSGGLDSTHALLVAVRTFDALGLPRSGILAFTLPAFATSQRTKTSAWRVMSALSVTAEEIDVTQACRQMLTDLGHPAARGEKLYDVTFENVQAGARTSLLFRLANQRDALVLGTGDLSELALGWCTYGVGDHMSHYNVNASVPKTLIQHLIRWVAAENLFGPAASEVLRDILDTEISPELIPGDLGEPVQRTEAAVGPYELQDFTLFYLTRYGFRPSKIAFLAHHAWHDRSKGAWPAHMESVKGHQYTLAEIKRWMELFLRRFFAGSQFKRSALPNGPKVSSGGSLSPRGDWRAPSDGSAAIWVAELEANVPDAPDAPLP